MTADDRAAAPAIVLDAPQLAENIGAVARVMANFGLTDLRLSRPRDGWPQERAWASASGANWPLDEAQVFPSVAEAISDLHLVFAATARLREAALPVVSPREAAAMVAQAQARGERCGFLLGGERAGLETQDVALAQAIVTIPIDARFHSLNLSHAAAILAYETRLAVDAPPPPAARDLAPRAGAEALQGFYAQLEGELDAAGFFHPPEKRPSMIVNLRAALGRAGFSDQEVRTLRGVVTALSKGRGRVLEKLARKAREG